MRFDLYQEKFLSRAVSSGQKNKFENTRAASKFGQQWARNILINLPNCSYGYNLHEIMPSKNEIAIVVASGPSLDKNIDFLAQIQDKVVIVTALRSVPVLQAAGIKPDIVVQLDAETDEVASKLANQNFSEIENYVYEPFISPGFLNVSLQKITFGRSAVNFTTFTKSLALNRHHLTFQVCLFMDYICVIILALKICVLLARIWLHQVTSNMPLARQTCCPPTRNSQCSM